MSFVQISRLLSRFDTPSLEKHELMDECSKLFRNDRVQLEGYTTQLIKGKKKKCVEEVETAHICLSFNRFFAIFL